MIVVCFILERGICLHASYIVEAYRCGRHDALRNALQKQKTLLAASSLAKQLVSSHLFLNWS